MCGWCVFRLLCFCWLASIRVLKVYFFPLIRLYDGPLRLCYFQLVLLIFKVVVLVWGVLKVWTFLPLLGFFWCRDVLLPLLLMFPLCLDAAFCGCLLVGCCHQFLKVIHPSKGIQLLTIERSGAIWMSWLVHILFSLDATIFPWVAILLRVDLPFLIHGGLVELLLCYFQGRGSAFYFSFVSLFVAFFFFLSILLCFDKLPVRCLLFLI